MRCRKQESGNTVRRSFFSTVNLRSTADCIYRCSGELLSRQPWRWPAAALPLQRPQHRPRHTPPRRLGQRLIRRLRRLIEARLRDDILRRLCSAWWQRQPVAGDCYASNGRFPGCFGNPLACTTGNHTCTTSN
jgi:hypothetical protein